MLKKIYYRALSDVCCPIDRGNFDVKKVWADFFWPIGLHHF